MRRKVFIRKYRPRDLQKMVYADQDGPVIVEWSRLGLYESRFSELKRQLGRKTFLKLRKLLYA